MLLLFYLADEQLRKGKIVEIHLTGYCQLECNLKITEVDEFAGAVS